MGTRLILYFLLMLIMCGLCQGRFAGKEFATAFMQNFKKDYDHPHFQLLIASLHATSMVKVSVPSLEFAKEEEVLAGTPLAIDLPTNIELSGSQRSNWTVLIEASEDIVVSSLNFKDYTADTSAVYPVTEWGIKYFVITPYKETVSTYHEVLIVNGKKPNTVKLRLSAPVWFQGQLYHSHSVLTIEMHAYESVQLHSRKTLTGTYVTSLLPIAVSAGHTCAWRFSTCDHVYEQLLPVASWGSHFLIPPLAYQTAYDSVFVQASRTTHLRVHAKGSRAKEYVLGRGESRVVELRYPNALEVLADHGVQVLLFFNGVNPTNGKAYDPFLMMIMPTEQLHCSSYTLDGLASFNNSALIVAKSRDLAGLLLDGLPLRSNIKWSAFQDDEYSWARVTYQAGAGHHNMSHASVPFALYSTGLADRSSYGSPALCITEPSCSAATCAVDEHCEMKGSLPTCVRLKPGVCWTMGRHYRSFDGLLFDFMGTCTYIMTKNCKSNNLPDFEVLTQNENRGNGRVSYIAAVIVNVANVTITVRRSENGRVRIGNTSWSLPVVLAEAKLVVFQSGRSIFIRTVFGLLVQYDWSHHVKVTMRGILMDNVCGLCGNFNNMTSDDMRTADGHQNSSVAAFGHSWTEGLGVDSHCQEDEIEQCDNDTLETLEGLAICELLTKGHVGPLSECHKVIDPHMYLQNCKHDLCVADGLRYHACRVLEMYAAVCQQARVALLSWREAARCPIECPPNSHYELCSSACPATCAYPYLPTCKAPCVETCACNDGFLQSGDGCVPVAGCGCRYHDFYVPAGESFWMDDACSHRCHCAQSGGKVHCEETGCRDGEHCQVVDGIQDCHPSSYATCMVYGEPHCRTFDGREFDFQGTCEYKLVGVCSEDAAFEHFDIQVQNDYEGSSIKLVALHIANFSIVISKERPQRVTVNDEFVNLPIQLMSGQLSIFRSCTSAVVQTTFGLKLAFDWLSTASVTLPSNYMGAVCGLCGDYDGNPQNDLTPAGLNHSAAQPSEFAASWSVEIPGCRNGCKGDCPVCNASQEEQYKGHCRLLLDPHGPFRLCHAELDPAVYFENCVYDLCFYDARRDVLCQAIATYVSACQALGVQVFPWRSSQFCGMACPLHSHYRLCASGCPATCPDLAPPASCASLCKEDCVCDQGFILSGHQCVPISQCGCLLGNRYYALGEVAYAGGGCEEECTCQQDGQMTCVKFSCGLHEKCGLTDGVRRCHPEGQGVCRVTGHLHYLSFDGYTFDLQGTCTYTLSKKCDVHDTHLQDFAVHVMNERRMPRGRYDVSVTSLVALDVYGYIFIMRRSTMGVLVDGVMTKLPFNLGGKVHAYHQGINCIIETDFGLKVTFDHAFHATVTVPGNYLGKTCGLCGNFDGDSSNDFQLPNGNVAPNVNAFGKAWKLDVPSPMVCDDGCEGDACPTCPSQLKTLFGSSAYCGILTDPHGPFAACHSLLSPTTFFNDCVSDVCSSEGSNEVACVSIAVYAFDCHEAGVEIQTWRTASFCPQLHCPANTHYTACVNPCSKACPGLLTLMKCPSTCVEGCSCDDGYLYNGQSCRPYKECGCYDNGRTYKPGEEVLEDDCTTACVCDPGKGLRCEAYSCPNGTHCLVRQEKMACHHPDPCVGHSCREKEKCQVEDGEPVCVPLYDGICWAQGDPHYYSFDGHYFDFQGTCKYIFAKSCGDLQGLVPFSIAERNENRGNPAVSYAREVELTVSGITVSFFKYDFGKVVVNGESYNLPLYINSQLSVTRRGRFGLVETSFGLRLYYDWISWIFLRLPSSYYGNMCGLCGNFNGNRSDELQASNEQPTSSLVQWARTWRTVDQNDPKCDDGCEERCPECSAEQRGLYEAENMCGAMSSAEGIFKACHSQISPEVFLQDCVFDMCLNDGDRRLLCQSLAFYSDTCREEGIVIGDWRARLNCSITCEPNSHYEACASPCPRSCPFPEQLPSCLSACVESCVCDEGFVLGADGCVPAQDCGCSYQGRYYRPDQSFWADATCKRLCNCDSALGMVVCRQASCGPEETCVVVDRERRCQPNTTGTCEASGNLHYRTFDGRYFDFQGSCKYQLVALCSEREGLTPFAVTVQNENRASTALAYTKAVTVAVYNVTVMIIRSYHFVVLVDGVRVNLPLEMKHKLVTYSSGNTVTLQTTFGLQVAFSEFSRVHVTLPSSYHDALCGLCGNYDGDAQDDLTMKDGTPAQDENEFGASWLVATVPGCSPSGCQGDGCPNCTNRQLHSAQQRCAVIANQTGPFQDCHARVDHQPYLENCVFDSCHCDGHQSAVCDAIAAYASACQRESQTIGMWRSPSFCPFSCPANSQYNLCAPPCEDGCASLFVPSVCRQPCAEGCQCNPGFSLSGSSCVPASTCGCFYSGRYYHKDEVFYPQGDCLQRCLCGDNGAVSCQMSKCSSDETCQTVNGLLGCHSSSIAKCVATGNLHYVSFDGRRFDFQGTCSYYLAKVCDDRGGRLPYFSVEVENELFKGSDNSAIRAVAVSVHNYTIHIQQKMAWRVMVNGEYINLPVELAYGSIEVNRLGVNVALQTDFGLQVLYNTNGHAEVVVPSIYHNGMCGLCGNYNGQPSDDFQLPGGNATASVSDFGKAWALVTPAVLCGGCGNNCSQCTPPELELYGKVDSCGLMEAPTGPFAACHEKLDPTPYVQNCILDMCALKEDDTLCRSIETYAIACQSADLKVQSWRSQSFCAPDCPANSHYSECADTCANSCAGLILPSTCSTLCLEGCQCDEGFVLEGNKCVSLGSCGCVYNCRYLMVGEALVDEACSSRCECQMSGVVQCRNLNCTMSEICEIRDGFQGCHRKTSHCSSHSGNKSETLNLKGPVK